MGKGQRIRDRIDASQIDDNFVVDFYLSEVDIMAIQLVYDMKAITANDIALTSGNTIKHIRDRLLKLYENRFLDRKFPVSEMGKGSKQGIYFLDEAGRIFVSGYNNVELKDVKWKKRENLLHGAQMDHTLGIAHTRAVLSSHARKGKDKIIEFKGDRDTRVNFKYNAQPYEFAPDGFFTYQKGIDLYDCFIEYDRATMTVEAFVKKVEKYEAYYKSKEFLKMYEVYPVILVIAPSMIRASNMCQKVRLEQKERDIQFYFTSIDEFEKDPFGKIWIIDGTADKVSIIE